MKEFKINENLVLKLEVNKTNIYVNGKVFLHCKYILLNFEDKEINDYKKFESMDQIIKYYDKTHESDKTQLDSETEFIGHCSNLQVWCENNYNLNILHTSLSLPLLRELARSGDSKARMAIKEEILIRLESKNEKVIRYFLNEEYFDYFEVEELEVLFEEIDIEDQELLKIINKYMNKKRILENLRKIQTKKIPINYNRFEGDRFERKIL